MTALELSDASLASRCREGEEGAWAELVERFSRYVYAIALQVYRLSEQDAEDVFQEVFMRVYEHLDEIRDDAAIKPWIAQVARRVSVDRLREAGRETASEHLPDPGALDETLGRLDEAMIVREALATLPESCHEVVDRFFARDQSYRTIAEALDIPQGTVASRISRCLARLRVELEGRDSSADPSS